MEVEDGGQGPTGGGLVLTERHDAVLVIILNRPRQRNALTYESWTELASAIEPVPGQPEVRAVVVTGLGAFFSAGGDLKTGPAHGTGPLAPAGRVEHAQNVLARLRALPIPVVAAVEGAALGLGWSLALACDFIVAAEDAYFAAPFVARAVVPDGGIAWQLTAQVGRHRAAQLLIHGDQLGAVEAQRLGLVNDVVPPGSALKYARALARRLTTLEPGALELTKRLIAAAETTSPAGFRGTELAMAVVAQQSSASARARADFG
jgi:enoyl-CoA hydratase/carnithine racemase